jgi:3-keto-L-gulonate-6-phosphate decarboxylase
MLERNKKYLQIAFNRPLEEIQEMINLLPLSGRIIVEVGYPLIKTYGIKAISEIKTWREQKILGAAPQNMPLMPEISLKDLRQTLKDFWQTKSKIKLNIKGPKKESITSETYIIADLKCMDRAFTEVEAAASAGASAATCLGLAPVETIDAFIKRCEEIGIDSMLDMMNIEYPFEVLAEVKKPPKIVMLHRGVDEREENREKEIPYHEIERIKSVYDDVLIAVAGGETISEVIKGAFNDADILVVWRPFNENPQKITQLADEFLKEIRKVKEE